MNNAISIIRQRYIDELCARPFDSSERLDEIKTLVCDGGYEGTIRYSDIDYKHNNKVIWELTDHMVRTLDLAIILKRGDTADTEEVKKLFYSSLDEWLKGDYLNPDGWFNEYTIPDMMADIALLWWDSLDDKRKNEMMLIIGRGSMRYNYMFRMRLSLYHLWGVKISIKHAVLLNNDRDYLSMIVSSFEKDIDFVFEGVQEDYSFHMHGPRLQSGAFARMFLAEMMSILTKLKGTFYDISSEKTRFIENFILDGERWMTHCGVFDWNVCGKEFSRPGWGGAGMVSGAAKTLMEVSEVSRKDELESFIDSVENEKPSVSGVKYFPWSQIMCTHIDDVYIGFKGTSPKTLCGEAPRGERLLGANMSYGTGTCVMKTGREYLNMSPLWDYSGIPGTTTRCESDEELASHPVDCNRFQSGDRFDGGQLGDCAYSAQTVLHNYITATVTAFGTPEGVIILGSGIRSELDEELITIVEQCAQTGEIVTDGDTVIHNGVKYINLDKENSFKTVSETRTNSWKRNNPNLLKDATVTEKVFELSLERGHNAYAYLIQPVSKNGRFEVIANTEDIQAIRIPDGRVFVHFFVDGEITVDGKKVTGKMHDCITLD